MVNNRTKITVITVCALLHGMSSASAAMISRQAGDVLVNEGQGYLPVRSEAVVAPGGRILVQPGGLAVITYDASCSIRVGPGFWMVQSARPCRHGEATIDFTQRMNQQTPPADPPGVNPLIVGGVIVAGAVGVGLIVANQNNKDRPASP